MQLLKQPFAVWTNHEDECKGHFFETRFYSGVLLTHDDLLSCMGYVDLNPVEAGIAQSLSGSTHTSINERLNNARFSKQRLENFLAPLWEDQPIPEDTPECTLKSYAEQLNLAILYISHPSTALEQKLEVWMARLINRERKKKRNIPAPFFDYI